MFISNALEPAAPVCLFTVFIPYVCVPLTGTRLVHLMPRSASLEQAGGLLRMTLRGHSGPVHKVVLSPNGRDVVTVSEDGTAQVGWVGEGGRGLGVGRPLGLSGVAALFLLVGAEGACGEALSGEEALVGHRGIDGAAWR